MRAFLIIVCLIASGFAAYFAQPYTHKNADLVLIVVTVYSVFAGFLIAIITIIGDPIMIRDGSWRVAEIGRGKMEARLFWHILLFVLYLLTIGLLFVGVVLERALDHHSLWRVWIERAYLFFGVSSFLFTFGLPGALLKMQYDRYDAEIARRRRDAHIQDDDVPNNPNG